MADLVEDIKAKLDIVDVVSQYVQLKKAGRNFKGLCPFHSEKTPSFVVSPEKQICHCFGCNKGGDIFTFIQELENVDFSEALQILADRAGVKVENISKFAKNDKKSEKDKYFKAHEEACEYFQKQLYRTEDGKKVLQYLYKRGLKDDTIRDFKLGFAPDGFDSLYPYLLKKNIEKNVLIKSGLVTSKSISDDRVYDKFRGRLIFPIIDYFGRVCAFGGRALKKEQSPKYLNSPENIIYSKSKVLYGLYNSKQHIKENDEVILVEGYFDVILPYQEGIKNIVAVSGTALTEEQAGLIKRLTPNAVISFDADEAGFEATKRAYSLLNEEDFQIKTISNMKGKDPADFVLNEGSEKFLKSVSESEDFVSYYINKLVSENNIDSIEGRRKVIKEMGPLLKSINPSNLDFYVRELSTKLNMKENFLYDEIERYKLPKDHPARKENVKVDNVYEGLSLEEVILALILEFPFAYKKIDRGINENDFSDGVKDIYKALSSQYNSARNDFSKWNFDNGFLAEVRGKIDVLRLYAEERYCNFSEESIETEVEKLVDKMNKTCRNKRLDHIRLKIEEAEKSNKKEELIELLKEQQKILSE